ncbi:ATP-binding protein [Kineococcus sp. SYSU DK006]|uniref:ATP-binding protein n=1 Tax=Kineococcus sp. SYSU DK006 TaxID=3383127 RepID=UPI003D7C4B9C
MTAVEAGGPVAARSGPERLDPQELRTLFLFERLDEEQLRCIADVGEVVAAAPGWLYREGEAPRWFFVLLEGAVALHHRVGGDDLEIGRTRQRGVYAGAWEAYLGDGAPDAYTSSLRVLEPSRFLRIPAATFGAVVREWFPMAVHLLEGLRLGLTEAQELAGARERLLALGSLTAGLTHELGNPAAALARTLAQLRAQVDELTGALLRLVPGGERLVAARAHLAPAPGPVVLDALARADAEDALLERIEDLGVTDEDADDLAATLADRGVGPGQLSAAAAALDGLPAAHAVPWLARSTAVDGLIAEAATASTRISELLASAGGYAQLDRAPTRWLDVRELLDASIDMLGAGAGRAAGETHLVRDYADVPQVLGHAGELTQVWTNLLDNALDALAGVPGRAGTVTVRVRPDEHDRAVVVEVADDGPGIAPEVLPRVFEPFVTTKDVGQGTGLGLDIAWRVVVQRHHGRLSVTSEPGSTVFRVWLPEDPGAVAPPAAAPAAPSAAPPAEPEESTP